MEKTNKYIRVNKQMPLTGRNHGHIVELSSSRLPTYFGKIKYKTDVILEKRIIFCKASTTSTHQFQSAHPDAIRRRGEAEKRRNRRRLEESIMMTFTRKDAVPKANERIKEIELENMKRITSVNNLIRELRCASNIGRQRDQLSGLSRISCLFFHAPWCRSCRVFQSKLYKIASEFPRVLFLSVDVSKCKDCAEILEVSKLPYLQFFDSPSGMIHDMTVSNRPQRILELYSHLKLLDVPKCDLVRPNLPPKLVKAFDLSEDRRCR